jgi:hypothetical protein
MIGKDQYEDARNLARRDRTRCCIIDVLAKVDYHNESHCCKRQRAFAGDILLDRRSRQFIARSLHLIIGSIIRNRGREGLGDIRAKRDGAVGCPRQPETPLLTSPTNKFAAMTYMKIRA